MNTIAGLENISSGEIVIDGVDVVQVGQKDRDIAMVFDRTRFTQTAVRGNNAFGLKDS